MAFEDVSDFVTVLQNNSGEYITNMIPPIENWYISYRRFLRMPVAYADDPNLQLYDWIYA